MISQRLNILLAYFVILIPLLLITGPFLPDLILTICGLVFILFMILNKKKEDLNSIFLKFFLFFILIIAANSLLSGNIKSIISSVGYIRFLFFTLCVIYILENCKVDIKLYIFYLLSFCYLYLSIEFVSQFLLGQTLLGNHVFNDNRFVLSSFYHEEIFSSYVVRFFPIFVGFFYISKKKLNIFFKVYFYSIVLFIVLSVTFNGERSSIGYLCLALFLMFIFLKEKLSKKIIAIISFFVLIIFLILNISEQNLGRKVEGLNSLKNTSIISSKNIDFSKIRIFSDKYNSMYRTSYNMFKENIFFGVGVKNFRILCGDKKYAYDKRSCSTHPHNLLLQIMAETGIIGLIYYVIIIISIIYFFVKNLTNKFINNDRKNYLTCLFISVAINLFPFLPSGNFFNNWMSVVFFFPVGFIIKELYFNKFV